MFIHSVHFFVQQAGVKWQPCVCTVCRAATGTVVGFTQTLQSAQARLCLGDKQPQTSGATTATIYFSLQLCLHCWWQREERWWGHELAPNDSAVKWQAPPTHRVFDPAGPMATLDIRGLGVCRPPGEEGARILSSKTLYLVCEERLTAPCGGAYGVGAGRMVTT